MNWEQGTGELETRNKKLGTGNWEQGTGNKKIFF